MRRLALVLALLLVAALASACVSDANAANPSVYSHPSTGGSWSR